MTCIAAIAEKGKVYIGADSAGVADFDLTVRADEKVFAKGSFVFGFTSSFRMGQLLRYKLVLPKQSPKMSDRLYMYTIFIDAVRKCLKEGGYTKINDNVEKGGTFIVGYKGHVYEIKSDFQISESIDTFASCGCGHAYAKAVLYTTDNNHQISPSKRILKALKTAEHFSAGVRRPFKIVSK